MKTSSAKAKGRKLQQMVVKTILEVNPSLHEDDVVSRPMGSGGEDIMLSENARSWVPFSFECKNTRAFPGLPALRQAEANSKRRGLPIVCWKPAGKGKDDVIAYFNLKDFLVWVKGEKMNG